MHKHICSRKCSTDKNENPSFREKCKLNGKLIISDVCNLSALNNVNLTDLAAGRRNGIASAKRWHTQHYHVIGNANRC